jgi:4,5-dihydroxyphthalate decarboxylase
LPNQPEPVIRLSCGEFSRTLPLLRDRAPVEGFALQVVPDPFPQSGLLADYQARRNLLMTDERAFDVCEMGLAPLLAARSRGIDLVAIPVFHYRRFRHSAIVCRTNAGIREPEDLVGKRVGVRRLSLSAGIWARGLLQHEYGIPLERIEWTVQVSTPLRPEIRDRLKLTVISTHEPLERLLARGELDATIEAFAIGPLRESSSSVHPLFHDSSAAEVDYYRRTRIFPIMHTIVMYRHLMEQYPDLPMNVYRAFARAKTYAAAEPTGAPRYVLADEEQRWVRGLTPEQRETFLGENNRGDPWTYSLQEGRITLETFLDYAFEQGIAHRRFAVEELFAPSTLNQ